MIIRCDKCGKAFVEGNRHDGLPNGIGFQTTDGTVNICAECIIKIGIDDGKLAEWIKSLKGDES